MGVKNRKKNSPKGSQSEDKKSILFVHPDLGIGMHLSLSLSDSLPLSLSPLSLSHTPSQHH